MCAKNGQKPREGGTGNFIAKRAKMGEQKHDGFAFFAKVYFAFKGVASVEIAFEVFIWPQMYLKRKGPS